MTIARIAALQSTLGWVAPMATRPRAPAVVQHRADGTLAVLDPKPVKAKAKRATTKVVMLTGEQFFDARMLACRAVAADVGENWHLVEGASYWGTIPPKMRKFVTARGSVCKAKPDARLPAPRYWPGGELPTGIVLSPDMPRDSTPRAVVLQAEFTRKFERAKLTYDRALEAMNRSRERLNSGGSAFTYGTGWHRTAHRENVAAAWSARADLVALRGEVWA
jgi:hypothetical protein